MARTKLINLRVTDEEHAALKRAADFNNCSLSEYVRSMATSESYKPMVKMNSTGPVSSLGYRCATRGCGFSAGSPAAVCPHHGRKVVTG